MKNVFVPLFALICAASAAAAAAKPTSCAYPFVTKVKCPQTDGSVQKVKGVNYRAFCGYNINDGDDIGSGTRTNTVTQCLETCNQTNGCVGVSVFRSSSSGNNCFLKSNLNEFDYDINGHFGTVDSYYVVTF